MGRRPRYDTRPSPRRGLRLTPESADVLLAARGLVLDRAGEVIFGPLSFSVAAGETVVVEGGNGAGKTTLLRILAGLLEPSAGELAWRGADYDGIDWPSDAIAWLGHQLGLKPDLTAREHLDTCAAIFGRRDGLDAASQLAAVNLAGYDDVLLRQLSAGQRKRIALAALSARHADLWLLDEPYANLDEQGRGLVDRMIEAHAAEGGATVLTSHGLIVCHVERQRTLQLHGRGDAA